MKDGRARQLAAVLGPCIGKTFAGAVGEYHFYEGRFGQSPLAIWVQFDGCSQVRIYCTSYGESVAADLAAPYPVNMEESGETVIRDISKMHPFRDRDGEVLTAIGIVATIRSSSDGQARVEEELGTRLHFNDGSAIYVLNWGDELYLSTELPPLDNSEEITEASIAPIQ